MQTDRAITAYAGPFDFNTRAKLYCELPGRIIYCHLYHVHCSQVAVQKDLKRYSATSSSRTAFF